VSNTKICTKCKFELPLSGFNKDSGNIGGLRSACKKCRSAITAQWRAKNKEYVNNQAREYKAKNIDNIRAISKKSQSKKSYKDKRKIRYKNRSIQDKLKALLRTRVYNALKGKLKEQSCLVLLGCTISEFKAHLESLFQSSMSWDNWSLYGWHIDHIIPLSSFDLSNSEELAKACHYTNLQPLWAKDNLSKSNKLYVNVE
jgi:hypothetical protein